MKDTVHLRRSLSKVARAQADDPVRIDVPAFSKELGDSLFSPQVRKLPMDDPSTDVFMARSVLTLEVKSLEAVGEGVMPDIMEKTGGEDGQEIFFVGGVGEGGSAQQTVQIPLDTSIDSQAMLETRVHGAGIDQVSRPEHANSSKALERGMIDDRYDPIRNGDVSKLGNADRARGKAAQAKLGHALRMGDGIHGLEGSTMKSSQRAVIARMEDVARGRRLVAFFEIAGAGFQMRLEPPALWVKAPQDFASPRRMQTRAYGPGDRDGSWLGLWPLQPGMSSSPWLASALLQSRLISWYVFQEAWRMKNVQFEAMLARIPWPDVPTDLGDQLRMLVLYRDELLRQEGDVTGADESIERVVIELFELEVDHLMTLDTNL